jgi:hypothetical protein
MTLSPALSHSLRHSQASIEGASPCLDVYSYLSIVSHEEILAVVNQIGLSSFPCLFWPTDYNRSIAGLQTTESGYYSLILTTRCMLVNRWTKSLSGESDSFVEGYASLRLGALATP